MDWSFDRGRLVMQHCAWTTAHQKAAILAMALIRPFVYSTAVPELLYRPDGVRISVAYGKDKWSIDRLELVKLIELNGEDQ